jgi:hypothetical protein
MRISKRLERQMPADRYLVLLIFFLGMAAAFLSSCSHAGKSDAPAEPGSSSYETPKHDLWVTVNGVNFQGVGVAERSPKYEITVWPEGSIDRIIWRTCNREEVVDKPKNGFWERVQGNNTYKFTIEPTKDLEDGRSCALEITVLEERQRRNGFAVIDFEDPREMVRLPAVLKCNGQTRIGNGVSICQSAAGLIQRIEFNEPAINRGAPAGCDVMKSADERIYEFAIPEGPCTYYFVSASRRTEDGKQRLVHRLNTIGYKSVPYRE